MALKNETVELVENLGKNPKEKTQTQVNSNNIQNVERIQIDLNSGFLPNSCSTGYWMTLSNLCGLISSRFKVLFRHYRGCTFIRNNAGEYIFQMLFTPAVNNPQVGNESLIDNIYKYGNPKEKKNDSKTNNQKFMETYVLQPNQNGHQRRTMTLTKMTKDILFPFMIRKINPKNNQQWVVDWNDSIVETEFNSQDALRRNETVLIVRNLDLLKILESIFTPIDVKFQDEMFAIKRFFTTNKIELTEENVKLYQGAKFYEILDQLNISPSYFVSMEYKGYKSQNGFTLANIVYNPYENKYIPDYINLDLGKFWVKVDVVKREEFEKAMFSMSYNYITYGIQQFF